MVPRIFWVRRYNLKNVQLGCSVYDRLQLIVIHYKSINNIFSHKGVFRLKVIDYVKCTSHLCICTALWWKVIGTKMDHIFTSFVLPKNILNECIKGCINVRFD